MYSVNKLGSNYQRGKPLPIERRNQILEKASYTSYRTLARLLGVSPSMVCNILKLHRETGGVDCRQRFHLEGNFLPEGNLVIWQEIWKEIKFGRKLEGFLNIGKEIRRKSFLYLKFLKTGHS